MTIPDTRSGCPSRLFFCWIWPVLKTTAYGTIQLKDIWQLDTKDQASTLYQQTQSVWQSRSSEKSNLNNSTPAKRGLVTILFKRVVWQVLWVSSFLVCFSKTPPQATVLRILESVMRFLRLWAVVFVYDALGDDEEEAESPSYGRQLTMTCPREMR